MFRVRQLQLAAMVYTSNAQNAQWKALEGVSICAAIWRLDMTLDMTMDGLPRDCNLPHTCYGVREYRA